MLKHPSVIRNKFNIPKKVYLATLEETKDDTNFGKLIWGEYITFIFIILIGNLELLTDFLKYSLIYNETMFTTVFIIIYLIIGLPLTSLNLFLGYFSKCGFFRLWSISPIYQGVGYTMLLLSCTSIIWSSVITSISLLYMLNLLRETIPWIDCNKMSFNNLTQCINFEDLHGTNNDMCCAYLSRKFCPEHFLDHPSFDIAALYYYRNSISNYDIIPKLKNNFITTFGYLKIELVMCLLVTWFITVILSTIGINKTKSLIRKFGTFASISLVACFILTLILGIPRSENLDYFQHSIFDTEQLSVLRLISLVFTRSLPLNMVCLGARAPSKTTPTIDALITSIGYLTMMFIFTFWLRIEISVLRYFFHFKSLHCVTRSGSEALLALIPDLIVNYFPIGTYFAFLYYFSIYTLGLLTQIIFVQGVLDSIEDIKPSFHQYRLQFCIFLCILSFVCGLVFTTPLQYVLIESWFFFARHFIVTISITLYGTAVIWIYGLDRLETDITFMYKTKKLPILSSFWLISWKLFPFMAINVFIFFVFNLRLLYQYISDQFYMKQVCVILSLVILLPIPCTALQFYFRNIRNVSINNAPSFFKNNVQWGPPDPEVRHARNRFNPRYQKRYKIDNLQCSHNCLLNSERLTGEIERLETNRKLFLEEIKKQLSEGYRLSDD